MDNPTPFHKKKTVITFGTFDIVHPGHSYYLSEAKKLWDTLVTIIATDANVLRIKNRPTVHSQETRKNDVQGLGISTIVAIGDEKDPYLCLRKYSPDIICLGYDQQGFISGLARYLELAKIQIEIVRIPAFQPEKFKSSKLRELI